ncbi:protein sel-1 homolog 3 isoform X2 [Betta splendens]|nr:protein sel-1 homolog 3 isoform X2 [Betta splendens]
MLRKTELVVFRRKWTSSSSQAYRIWDVVLTLPPSISYGHDFFNRNVLEAENATVRAWLDLKDGRKASTYHSSILRTYKVLRVTALSERPNKLPTECPSWAAQLTWRMMRSRILQCLHESDVADMIAFPLASTGERFGVVRLFQPFVAGALESARLHAVTQPSAALSVWIYLLNWCHKKYCGIIHHVDRNMLYSSVLMQLTDTGNVVIQARVTTGEDEAFRASVVLPLWKWIRLDCYIQNSQVVLNATWSDKTRTYVYVFQNNIHYDDTDGYFGIGGNKYLSGIHAYFGPIKYYRLGTEEIKNELQPKATLEELDRTHQECQEIKALTQTFLQQVTESHSPSPINKGVCTPRIMSPWGQLEEETCTQTWSWETQLKYKTLFQFLKTKEEGIRTGSVAVKHFGTALFQEAVATMFSLDQITITSKSTALLQLASCFGNHKASLLLASIYFSSMGHSVNQQQGLVYSLIGASGDDRFALMHAGYKHTHGIDGFPKDLDMAYGYYSNAAAQSMTDSSRIHDQKQITPEHIYLSSPDDLSSLTHETNDDFQYLKLLAERGDLKSQRRLGMFLYWGQRGVTKDAAGAVKWFERSAMQMKDPTATYDYAILVLKGLGVKRNHTRGFQLLKKAAEMGSINALNGLGWYHGEILNNHAKAVKYFEQAAMNGSEEALFNLGVYHLNGKNPENPWTNETAAFLLFLNASDSGHVTAAVEASWYLSTGRLEGVSQDVGRAVIMLKKVCEQNGHLGFMIREALQAYLKGSWQEALVKYVMAAETGLGSAQSNAAHLCEELNLSHDCQWRYRNYSVLGPDPHPSALLKMGDHYYRSSSCTQENSLSLLGQAVSMYSRAALAGSPQGMYNLAVLVQQGCVLPLSARGWFNVTRDDELDAVVEKILRRCVESENEKTVTPCSLALLRVQIEKALRRMTQNGAQLLLTYASVLSICVVVAVVTLQSCFEQRAPSRRGRHRHQAGTSPGSQDEVNSNAERDADVGGLHRAAGNLWLRLLNGGRWLGQTGDLAVTLAGVCLCAFWTTLLYHLL